MVLFWLRVEDKRERRKRQAFFDTQKEKTSFPTRTKRMPPTLRVEKRKERILGLRNVISFMAVR